MAQVNGFDFSKYDVGGSGATAGDGRLTGAEVAKAKADGWTIWDGCSKNDKIEKYEEKEAPEGLKNFKSFSAEGWKKISRACFLLTQMQNSSSYKEYQNLAKQKLEENLQNGMDINQAMEKAKKDALKELGLTENAFNGRWDSVQLLDYGMEERRCSISKEEFSTFIDSIKNKLNK